MGNKVGGYILLCCPRCGIGKDYKTRSYGAYKVFIKGTNLKFVCKTCKYVIRYRFIDGGQNNE